MPKVELLLVIMMAFENQLGALALKSKFEKDDYVKMAKNNAPFIFGGAVKTVEILMKEMEGSAPLLEKAGNGISEILPILLVIGAAMTLPLKLNLDSSLKDYLKMRITKFKNGEEDSSHNTLVGSRGGTLHERVEVFRKKSDDDVFTIHTQSPGP